MTPSEFEAIRIKMGQSRYGLGRALGLISQNPQETIGRWERGDDPISGPVALCMRYMAKYGVMEAT